MVSLRYAYTSLLVSCLCLVPLVVRAAEPIPPFFRGINFNGPSLVIDGQLWDGADCPQLTFEETSFENQQVVLDPATDESRSSMLRSSIWAPGGHNRVRLIDVPPGEYTLYLYVWEDNDPQSYSVFVQGREVLTNYNSGTAGHWDKLGPWIATVEDGTLELTSSGGAANWSGLEIWGGPGTPDRPVVDPEVVRNFDSRLAPLLSRHCLGCHNASDKKGGLDLSTRAAALAGGDSGPVFVANEPAQSPLWLRTSAQEMPPKTPLSTDELALIKSWIESGAQWGTDRIDPFLFTTDQRAGYDWWSLSPPTANEPPAVRRVDWPANAVDLFILHELEARGLSPSPEADRRTLIRRLYFDLWGLPPAAEEVSSFINDPANDAYEKLVDRLLDSPHFGERWGRHWLDVVRFGESQGFERNKLRPNAWRYRDWVVEAINDDLPYDEFARQQIAGDVLRPDDPLAVIASGFLVMGPYDQTAYTDGTLPMRAFAREEELEGLVGTVSQTFLGLTINCARCHDHKFDPISQREYYQVASALGGTYHGDEREYLSDRGREAVTQQVADLNTRIAALREEALATSDSTRQRELTLRAARWESKVRLLQGGPAHLSQVNHPGVFRILARGDFRQPGEPVTPRGVASLSRSSELHAEWGLSPDAPEGKRREALAEWIANARNPLTARVVVNRLWSHHFGAGLVGNANDFGFNGGLPSHPALLDWLARELVTPSSGQPWSLKRVHRLLLLSATYRQASRPVAAALAIDAENRLLWRYTPHRLDAETLRDAILSVSGQLDGSLGGPGFRDFTTQSSSQNEIYEVFDAIGPEFNRRSLYRTWLRTGTSPWLDLFDCPDPSVATPRRNVTTTPLQALALLNNAFVEHQAQKFAERIQSHGAEPAMQVERAWRIALARDPTADEADFAGQFVQQHGLAQLCVVLFNTSEFLYVD